MSAQNIYDDPDFFAGFARLPRSELGLAAVFEWPAFERLLPASLVGKRVLDFGCGFGYFAREMRARGAREVVGIDLSERMLQAAGARTDDQGIVYRRADLAHFQPDIAGFDLVLSSLMLHYLADYPGAERWIAACLAPGGRFAFSVEHPIYTAPSAAAWHTGPDGANLHWPLDHYRDEGERRTHWFIDGVVKYHRTVETYVNVLLAAGLVLARLEEPEASDAQLARFPTWREERRRPPFLLIAADRPL